MCYSKLRRFLISHHTGALKSGANLLIFCQIAKSSLSIFKIICQNHFLCVILQKQKGNICGSSSVGRALASQAGGRGFEPRLPLFKTLKAGKLHLSF